MQDFKNMSKKDKFHMSLVVNIWERIAGLVYSRYKKEGRGVVVMFMLDDIPGDIKEILPPLPKTISVRKGAVATAYVPRDELHMLEKLLGEQGLLKLDRELGQYNPDTTIVFAVIETKKDTEGTAAVTSSGFDVTPPPCLYPRELYKNGAKFGVYDPVIRSKNNPLLTLN